MVVSIVMAAARRGSAAERSCPVAWTAAVRQQQPRAELGEQRAAGGHVRSGQLEQELNRGAQGVHRVTVSAGGGVDLAGRPAQGVFVEREQELMLAVEVLVEAAQRQAGPFHDVMDGEVHGRLLGDDGRGRVEEPLDPLLGPQLGRPGGPFDRALLPVRFSGVPGFSRFNSQRVHVLRHWCNPSCETVVLKYCTLLCQSPEGPSPESSVSGR
jgi:hypothetical protein